MICDVCMRMFQLELPGLDMFADGEHHRDIASLASAAADGCHVCAPFLSCISKESPPLDGRTWTFRYRISRHTLAMLVADHSGEPYLGAHYPIAPVPDILSDLVIRGRTPRAAMSDGIKTAQMWMRKCSDGHEQCLHNQTPASYPTRMLELRDSTVRLVIPRETKTHGPYAALSYCWGPNPTFLELTSTNAQKIKAGLLYTDLPIAFQEATRLAIGLNIHYIWIDCLCIIQSGPGHEEDWLAESSKMQDVYTNCIVNISLARPANPHESCFEVVGPDTVMPFRAKRNWSLGREKTRSHVSVVIPDDYFEKNLYGLPLGRRAWVLQERILAPRVISFGRGELFWECGQRPDVSEMFPDGLDADMRFRMNIRRQDTTVGLDASRRKGAWYSLLDEYTKRRLTKPETDKLVAISAVAAKFEEATNDKYVEGIFLAELPFNLLWRVTGNVNRLRNGAPSWSWASVDGPLEQPGTYDVRGVWRTRLMADVVSCASEPAENKGPGGVSLTIKTFCARLNWKQGNHRLLGESGIWTYLARQQFAWDVPVDDSGGETLEYLVVLIATQEMDIGGLILRESDVGERRGYERVGHFRAGIDITALQDAHGKLPSKCDSIHFMDWIPIVARLQEKESLVLV